MSEMIKKLEGFDEEMEDVEYGKEDEAIAKIINDFKEELDA